MISAILLAAGESRRMGDFKQLLTFDGKSFVECCVDQLMASRATEVIVVTGHRDADVRRALGERNVHAIHNPDYQKGMASSVKCGVAAASPAARAVMIALVDQPQIGVAIIDRVIAEYEAHRSGIVIPTYGGRNGHPILIDLRLRDDLLSFNPSQGLRQVVQARADDVVRVEVGDPAVLTDIDYPEDYASLIRR
jgi:molybdenum cofactor cytidylyltransferase